MADASNAELESDLLETRKRLEVLDKNYRNLKGLSQRGERFITMRTICLTKLSSRKICSAVNFLRGWLTSIVGLPILAVTEFEELQKKYQDYYEKASILFVNLSLFLFE